MKTLITAFAIILLMVLTAYSFKTENNMKPGGKDSLLIYDSVCFKRFLRTTIVEDEPSIVFPTVEVRVIYDSGDSVTFHNINDGEEMSLDMPVYEIKVITPERGIISFCEDIPVEAPSLSERVFKECPPAGDVTASSLNITCVEVKSGSLEPQ